MEPLNKFLGVILTEMLWNSKTSEFCWVYLFEAIPLEISGNKSRRTFGGLVVKPLEDLLGNTFEVFPERFF